MVWFTVEMKEWNRKREKKNQTPKNQFEHSVISKAKRYNDEAKANKMYILFEMKRPKHN